MKNSTGVGMSFIYTVSNLIGLSDSGKSEILLSPIFLIVSGPCSSVYVKQQVGYTYTWRRTVERTVPTFCWINGIVSDVWYMNYDTIRRDRFYSVDRVVNVNPDCEHTQMSLRWQYKIIGRSKSSLIWSFNYPYTTPGGRDVGNP